MQLAGCAAGIIKEGQIVVKFYKKIELLVFPVHHAVMK